ncbi:MAG: FAD-dependent oxidoreductase [Chloroflexi bacterium]|nr:FAD-dependent oxidoreductase [Chloroflexota bacterium]
MRDVVVIGGGLSGLSAAYELDKLGAPYTIIEVKRRFGGAIGSRAEAGFIMDASAFAFCQPALRCLPPEFDFADSILPIGANAFVFRGGAESLVRAYASRQRGGGLMRMAVSSVGRLRGRFTLCLENGLMLDAGALILAVPAPYAARMLRNLAPGATQRLLDFRYDPIRRVSLGYRKRDLPTPLETPRDETFPFVIATDQPSRVPDRGHLLIQVGFRSTADLTAEQSIRVVTQHLRARNKPLAARADYWAEADLLSDYAEDHRECIRQIRALLPAGLSLIGSDYCSEAPETAGVARLDERIQLGAQAARDAVRHLQARRKR